MALSDTQRFCPFRKENTAPLNLDPTVAVAEASCDRFHPPPRRYSPKRSRQADPDDENDARMSVDTLQRTHVHSSTSRFSEMNSLDFASVTPSVSGCNCFYYLVRVGDVDLLALLDSGSAANVLSASAATQLHLQLQPTAQQLRPAFPTSGITTLTANFRNVQQKHSTAVQLEVYVAPIQHDLILGMPFLQTYRPQLDWVSGKISFHTSSAHFSALPSFLSVSSFYSSSILLPPDVPATFPVCVSVASLTPTV